jgi:hypothetical protein
MFSSFMANLPQSSVLSFDGAGICDTIDKIFLAVEEEQERRYHIDCGDGEGKPDFARIDGGEKYGQRLFFRVGQKDERLFHHVPVVDEHEDGDGIERASAWGRQTWVKSDTLLPVSFAARWRPPDAAHKFCQQENGKRGEGAGQDDRPAGIETPSLSETR